MQSDHKGAVARCSIIGEVTQALTLVASSGVMAGAYSLLKSWIDAKNGQKLRPRVGEIESKPPRWPRRMYCVC